MSARAGLTLSQAACLVADETSGPLAARRDEIVARAKAGDAAAFALLVRRHRDGALSTAWRLLGNREDAADAAQDAFLRAHRYLGSFDESQDFGGWFYTIVVNVCRTLARRRHTAAHTLTDVEAEPAAGCDPEAMADRRRASDHLERALDTLTERERVTFVLRDLEGLSTEEVARRLGVTVTTVRVHVCMARKKLHRHCAAGTPNDTGEKP